MKKNNKGFSLIELSIVLIIMGLLIAGVTGGASLIKSAQLRSVVTEATNYRTAFNTYYAQFGKVPGADTTVDPNIVSSGALQALFNEGIIDKKPSTESEGGEEYISSKFGKGSRWYLVNAEAATEGGNYMVSDFTGLNVLAFSKKSDFSEQPLTNREAYNVDEKVDDGDSTTGLLRGIQYSESTASNAVYDEDTESERNFGFVMKLDF
ncbi:MAG: prepilin-type N-terminal cleavage/methylation domain-containing protein [Rickettsiales bacterium]|nr:prepilin-type N-terminal cleavage/methylation domain-containing protein [Rickettsiales bacterium]